MDSVGGYDTPAPSMSRKESRVTLLRHMGLQADRNLSGLRAMARHRTFTLVRR